jgi:hypothetical protein
MEVSNLTRETAGVSVCLPGVQGELGPGRSQKWRGWFAFLPTKRVWSIDLEGTGYNSRE